MANWLEADNGFLVNLDKVQAIQRASDYSTTIYFRLGEMLESVTCSMPYESLKGLIQMRSDREVSAQDEIRSKLRVLAAGSYTPVP